jgi:hypothetical protein
VIGAKAGEYLAENTPHRRPVGGGDNTYRGAAPRMEDTSELCQPKARVRKELQAKLADDGVKTTALERQGLAVSGYRPKRWFAQPAAHLQAFEGSTLANEEAQLGAGMDDLRGGSRVLRFSGGTPPRRRGDVRRVWLSPRHRRLCYLPPAGELGAASPDCVLATAVLGILGLLGPGVGAVLALTRPSDPGPSLNRTSPSPLPTAGRRGHSGSG